jgi:hypothetical protein
MKTQERQVAHALVAALAGTLLFGLLALAITGISALGGRVLALEIILGFFVLVAALTVGAGPRGLAVLWLLALLLWAHLLDVIGKLAAVEPAYGRRLLRVGAYLPERFATWSVFAIPLLVATQVFRSRQLTSYRSMVAAACGWFVLLAAAGYWSSLPDDPAPRVVIRLWPLVAGASLSVLLPLPIVIALYFMWRLWPTR